MDENHSLSTDLVFDHIGIVVPDVEAGREELAGMLGPLLWTRCVDDARLGVSVRFGRDQSGIVYELIAPFGDSSPIGRTLESRANLLHQIAYRTKSLDYTVKRLRRQGAIPVSAAAPALAFDGARVQFLMVPLGFLIELIEGERVLHVFS